MKSYVGKQFGKLTVVEDLGYYQKKGTLSKRHYVKCRCECGKEKIIRLDSLKSDEIISCGCYKNNICYNNGKNSKKYNDFYIKDNVVHVVLYNSHNELLCDKQDWELLKKYCWSEKNGYARARDCLTNKNVLFHKFIIKDVLVDHINGNGLDNRRCNLRMANKSQNAMNQRKRIDNSSGYKGIRKLPSGRYQARITINGIEKNLGIFDNIEDAIEAREEAEIKYFGEWRRCV